MKDTFSFFLLFWNKSLIIKKFYFLLELLFIRYVGHCIHPGFKPMTFMTLLTLNVHAREGYSSQFVCLSTPDLEDGSIFTFETGIYVD